MLYRHGKPLEEELALSDLTGGRTNSASQLRQDIIIINYSYLGVVYVHGRPTWTQ